MTLWMVRGDKHGQQQDLALEQGFAYAKFKEVPDLSATNGREDILEICREIFLDATEAKLRNFAAQLFSFVHRIQENDMVIMPLRSKPQMAIGRITGPYQYRPDLEVFHTRPTKWLRDDIPRTAFGQDLLYSLGAYMTVCRIKRNNAEARILEILEDKKDPVAPGPINPEEAEDEGELQSDVEQLARDQILSHIEHNFKGHDLSRLVEALLRAEGYKTRLSNPGPDGGVDILAGGGPLGFEIPRLCVQVKSSTTPVDVTILRNLQGSMSTFKADQGLLVCWGGYNKMVEREAGLSFFSVRLWDANDLLESLMKNYERLPEALQKELPLKRICALVVEE
jgi:restriction system protein